jgi:Skp family chaperone for outer membrane proteins
MSSSKISLAGLLLAMFVIAGCDQMGGGKSSVAIIDLSAVASATGQDEEIRRKAEEGTNELMGQLQQLATGLDQQIIGERAKLEGILSPEDEQRMADMTNAARQQIAMAQQQAQQQAQQFQSGLVMEFRDSLVPVTTVIARQRGATVVLNTDIMIFWAEDSIDITADVIAAWNAENVTAEPAAEPESVEAAPTAAEADVAIEEAAAAPAEEQPAEAAIEEAAE